MNQEHFCLNHPDRKALSFCHHCHEYFCHECLKEGPEYYYCNRPSCLKAFEEENKPPEVEAFIPPDIPDEPDEPEALAEDLIPIGQYQNSIEANLAKTKLDSEGIESFLFDEYERQIGLIPPATLDAAFGGIKLMVRESEARKASQILESRVDL